jgi:UDP-N-acetylmuramoylalanine--D-glutamate ligase
MKSVLVIGAGESGVGGALLAQSLGYNVLVSDFSAVKNKYKTRLDKAGIPFEENGHVKAEAMLDSNLSLVIKSPGVPDVAPLVKRCHLLGIEIIDEIEFAFRNSKGKAIAITGSNGKTTTTSLVYHILQKAGLNVGLAGNIGASWAGQLAENGDKDYWVLELSSFQLDGLVDFKAHISVITNISPDHLDRYEGRLENYIAAKLKVLNNQSEQDYFVFNVDDKLLAEALSGKNISSKNLPFSLENTPDEGAFIKDNQFNVTVGNKSISMSVFDVSLKGKHNAQNAMAAAIASRVLDIRKEVIRESLQDFEGIEHRLENVATINGVDYINDSKATNVNSTWWALESCNKPVVWIAGGVDKGNDYTELLPMVKEKVKAIICLGNENQKIKDAFEADVPVIVECNRADQAVSVAYSLASKGDMVLLSPACASFDLFKDYQDRGTQFKNAVKAL